MQPKYYICIILLFSFTFFSCSSYHEISLTELQKSKPKSLIKIENKDKSEFETLLKDIYMADSLLVTSNGYKEMTIRFSEIEKLYTKKFDILYTILLIPGLCLGLLIAYLILSGMHSITG